MASSDEDVTWQSWATLGCAFLTAMLLVLLLNLQINNRDVPQIDVPVAVPDGVPALQAVIAFWMFIGIGISFYVTPTIVAVLRKHKNTASIAVVNCLLGWTVVGYVVALAWAFTAEDKP